ncbi:MAG: outer membrane protein assembly factor BamC [Pseudomonadota bacterium]
MPLKVDVKTLARVFVPAATLVFLAGCSHIPGMGKDDAREARRSGSLPNLEVPPAFTTPDPALVTSVPRAATASGEAAKGEATGGGVLLKSATVSIEGSPDARWLKVQAAPDSVWPRLASFLQEEGYNLDRQDPKLGILESDWTGGSAGNPNRGGLQGLLQGITRLFFVPDHMDRVRLRMERGEADTETRVFLTSQRMERVEDAPLVPGGSSDTFKWAMGQSNTDFEAEMLKRLMVFLSGDDAQARAQLAASLQPRARMVFDSNKDVRYLLVQQSFPVVLNRTRAAVERLGFDVVKQDAADGTLQLKHQRPRSLYEGVILRGAELKEGTGENPVAVTLKFKPLENGDTRIDMTDLAGDQELPKFQAVLGDRLSQMLR